MRQEEFDFIVKERIEKIVSVLQKKGAEYATYEDRLHNFKRAANLMRCTPAEALLGMYAKQIVSVIDLVKQGIREKEVIDEKIGDSINYLILLEAILKEDVSVPKK